VPAQPGLYAQEMMGTIETAQTATPAQLSQVSSSPPHSAPRPPIRPGAVISVTGDGGFSWTMQELSTLRRYGLGMVTVVFNDAYFGNVRRIQKNRYGGRYFASDLTNPDYQQLAGAFGIGFACARDPGSLVGVLRDAMAASEPMLVEVPVGEFPSQWHLIHEGIPRSAPIAPRAHPPTERRRA
jgi:acetolactate synthase-1/2/3 large subunit